MEFNSSYMGLWMWFVMAGQREVKWGDSEHFWESRMQSLTGPSSPNLANDNELQYTFHLLCAANMAIRYGNCQTNTIKD